MIKIAKGFVEALVVIPKRLRGVDVQGSSVISGESLEVDFLAVKNPLMILELVHGEDRQICLQKE